MRKLKLHIKATQSYINTAREIRQDNIRTIFMLILLIIIDCVYLLSCKTTNFPIWHIIFIQCIIAIGVYSILLIRKQVKLCMHVLKKYPPKAEPYYSQITIYNTTELDNLLLAFSKVGLEVVICDEEDTADDKTYCNNTII